VDLSAVDDVPCGIAVVDVVSGEAVLGHVVPSPSCRPRVVGLIGGEDPQQLGFASRVVPVMYLGRGFVASRGAIDHAGK